MPCLVAHVDWSRQHVLFIIRLVNNTFTYISSFIVRVDSNNSQCYPWPDVTVIHPNARSYCVICLLRAKQTLSLVFKYNNINTFQRKCEVVNDKRWLLKLFSIAYLGRLVTFDVPLAFSLVRATFIDQRLVLSIVYPYVAVIHLQFACIILKRHFNILLLRSKKSNMEPCSITSLKLVPARSLRWGKRMHGC